MCRPAIVILLCFSFSRFPATLDDLLQQPTSYAAAQLCDSPGVGEEAVEDAGPAVLGRQHHRLPQVVVLLLRVACAAHHSGLHEGGPGVGQQVLDASLVHLRGRWRRGKGAQWSGVSFTQAAATAGRCEACGLPAGRSGGTPCYHADASDSSPVRFLVHSGRLVELAEEEVDLLLEPMSRWDDGRTGKLRIWWRDSRAKHLMLFFYFCDSQLVQVCGHHLLVPLVLPSSPLSTHSAARCSLSSGASGCQTCGGWIRYSRVPMTWRNTDFPLRRGDREEKGEGRRVRG